MKFHKYAISFGIILTLASPLSGWAAYRSEPDYHSNLVEITRLKNEYRINRQYYGEIISLTPKTVQLANKNQPLTLKINRNAKFYCNGHLSSWGALLPVASEAYFEATVYLNAENEVCLINGYYYGSEAIIHDYQYVQGRLKLTLMEPESAEIKEYWVDRQAVVPQGITWLERDRAVYVLYNYCLEIRGIYLSK